MSDSNKITGRPALGQGLLAATLMAASVCGSAHAGVLQADILKTKVGALTQRFNGKVGFCARDGAQLICSKGERAFPMQSVMKLLVAVAVMDRVDQGQLGLNDNVVVRSADGSVCVQPILDRVPPSGAYRTSIDALLTSMVVDSDCAAADLLLARLGGPEAVRALLARKDLTGLRLDRDERHLQTEIDGLEWRSAFVEPAVLKRAEAAVPGARRQAAFDAYLKDPRDTASPAAMTLLLQRLSDGRLLSAASTDHLLSVMTQTRTGSARLKAGLRGGWRLAHKTGTGGAYGGVFSAVNDVGVLTAPDGGKVMVAAFVSKTRVSVAGQERLIAALARAVVDSYTPQAEAIRP